MPACRAFPRPCGHSDAEIFCPGGEKQATEGKGKGGTTGTEGLREGPKGDNFGAEQQEEEQLGGACHEERVGVSGILLELSGRPGGEASQLISR